MNTFCLDNYKTEIEKLNIFLFNAKKRNKIVLRILIIFFPSTEIRFPYFDICFFVFLIFWCSKRRKKLNNDPKLSLLSLQSIFADTILFWVL